jgi:hypothetical protein
MKRRDLGAFLVGVMAAPAAGPSILRAQQTAVPSIGYVSGRSLATDGHLLSAFREGLGKAGFVDGQNVTMDIRWADGRYDRIPELMADVVKTKPTLIVALGGNQVGLTAKAMTSTIPIVFGTSADPVSLGLVSHLGRPNGNLTGITLLATALDAKRVELLREMVPTARSVAILFNPSNPGAADQLKEAQAATTTLGFSLKILEARTEAEIDRAFEVLDSTPVDVFAVTVEFVPDNPAGADRGGDSRTQAAGDVPVARVHRLRGARELRATLGGHVPNHGPLCRPHPQGGEAKRLAGPETDDLRTGSQPQDREDPGPYLVAGLPPPC